MHTAAYRAANPAEERSKHLVLLRAFFVVVQGCYFWRSNFLSSSFRFKLAEMQLVVVLQVVTPFLTEQVVILQTGTTFGVTFSLSCLMDLTTDEVALPVELVADT
ncbi:hypothetical protein DAPPUDRAFT_274429 [Daphnia pulex]|uniref:Uncharacterized protein n=1 Tax=Daphnia pulex TaxID=6669 RepID=E9I477_DAPPU|nr:hypothetical protein DAPPUDRAFT_274429 [Daphnia pulex]|eukprot:EFX61199.1 hypothetical protein DAPPUDRAFT_274429 [Daphnia pulex]